MSQPRTWKEGETYFPPLWSICSQERSGKCGGRDNGKTGFPGGHRGGDSLAAAYPWQEQNNTGFLQEEGWACRAPLGLAGNSAPAGSVEKPGERLPAGNVSFFPPATPPASVALSLAQLYTPAKGPLSLQFPAADMQPQPLRVEWRGVLPIAHSFA